MAKEHIETTVMFADVADSTPFYEKYGDDDAHRVIGKAMELMSEITRLHQGQVIKTSGDEIMCRFPTADDCVRTAAQIQEEMLAGIQGEEARIGMRIGLHFGSAILMDDGDLFGDAVNVAHRMSDIAQANQIITTEETARLLSAELRDITREFDKTAVKGKAGEITVCQVVWEQSEDITRIGIAAPAEEQMKHLFLEYRGQTIRLGSDDQRNFVIGRGAQSDLLCEARLASRTHAKIAFKRGKFLLNDQSSNGTFVRTDDGESIFVKRQEIMLWGSGYIGLGQDVSMEDTVDVIRYICE